MVHVHRHHSHEHNTLGYCTKINSNWNFSLFQTWDENDGFAANALPTSLYGWLMAIMNSANNFVPRQFSAIMELEREIVFCFLFVCGISRERILKRWNDYIVVIFYKRTLVGVAGALAAARIRASTISSKCNTAHDMHTQCKPFKQWNGIAMRHQTANQRPFYDPQKWKNGRNGGRSDVEYFAIAIVFGSKGKG